MPGLVPGIHVFLCEPQDVDGRDKRSHDDVWVRVLYENAWMPVMARPRISAWTSCVPS